MRSQYTGTITPPPPTISFGIGAITASIAGNKSAYLQGRNRAGVTTFSSRVDFTVAPNQSVLVTIPAAARQPASDLQEVILSLASSSTSPADAVVIASWPGYEVDGITQRALPATITLSEDEHLELAKSISDITQLPAKPINGMRRNVDSLSQILCWDSLRQIWNTVHPASLSTYVSSSLAPGGCDRDIAYLDDLAGIITPDYDAQGGTPSPPVGFWIVNDEKSATPAGTRVGITVELSGVDVSSIFEGLLDVIFLGYANTATGELDTSEMDVGGSVPYTPQTTSLVFPKALPPNWAYSFQIQATFSDYDLGNRVPQGATLRFYPFLYPTFSVYSPGSAIAGNYLIANPNDPTDGLRRIVPSQGLTALALSGSGTVAKYSFESVGQQTVVGLKQNIPAQKCVITNNATCFIADSVPTTADLRALVGTVDGVGSPTSWTAIQLNNTKLLEVQINYPAAIRTNYPDAIAGSSRGTFNAYSVRVYVKPSNGNILQFENLITPSVTADTFTFGSLAGLDTGGITLTPALDPSFGLYAPTDDSYQVSSVIGNSVFASDNYQVAIAFYFQNTVTSISHDEALGCILTATASFAELEQRSRYWAEAVADVKALRYMPLAKIYPYQSRLNVKLNKPYRYDPSSYASDDGYSVVKPNKIENNLPGRWVLDDSSTWYSGSGAPDTTLGAIGDYYLETDVSVSTVGNVWRKSVDNVWSIAGNIRGPKGQPPLISIGNVQTLPAESTPTVTNTGDLSQAIFNFGIPTGSQGPIGPGATITIGSVTTLNPDTQATVVNSGSLNQAVLDFGIPSGAVGSPGPIGESGAAATISVGTITTLPPGNQSTVSNSGTSSHAILDFGIPQGIAGPTGSNATFSIGTTTTLTPNSTATVTNSGTTSNAILNFGIPAGAMGATGPPGFSPTRTTTSVTTGILSPGGTARTTINIARNAQIFTLSTNVAARVRLYQDDASASADSSRATGTYPESGTGLILEVITIDSQLSWNLMRTPFAANLQPPPATSFPILITNNEEYSTAITVTLAILILEQ